MSGVVAASDEAGEFEVVDIRCPVGPRRLFARLRLSGEKPGVTGDNLLEMSCQDCRRRLGKDQVKDVFHLYSIVGELVTTKVVYHNAPPVEH